MYQELFQYMMIDEYQDTNSIQEKLIFKLSATQNICVVGDDDQSMYRFRGATIENILNFKNKFLGKAVSEIKLVTNYRSAPEIINFYNKWMSDYSASFFSGISIELKRILSLQEQFPIKIKHLLFSKFLVIQMNNGVNVFSILSMI